jgi:hypothetical protein
MSKELSFDSIQKSKRLKRKFLKAFLETLDSIGETPVVEATSEYIFNVFKARGYWSGVKYNVMFDPILGFEYEDRSFKS